MKIKKGIGIPDVLRVRKDLKKFAYGGYYPELTGCRVEILKRVIGEDKVIIRFLERKYQWRDYSMNPDELEYYED